MEFQVDSASSVPIYRQLRGQVREAVARGKLRPKQRMPSVRELSRTLVVNPNTIARVYTELEREGMLNARPGLGMFVAEPRDELTREIRQERLQQHIDHFLTEAVHLGFSAEEVVSQVTGQSDQFQWRQQSVSPVIEAKE